MENTLENKAKFFAQYWRQEVFKLEGLNKVYSKPFDNILQDDYLLLKPLSSITDEDAVEVAKIFYPLSDTIHTINKGKNLIDVIQNQDTYLLSGAKSIYAGQYLQSKGYALPYMCLSVEKLIEYGWIKLKID